MQYDQIIRDPVWITKGCLYEVEGPCVFPLDAPFPNWHYAKQLISRVRTSYEIDCIPETSQEAREYCECLVKFGNVIKQYYDEYESDRVYVGACLTRDDIEMAARAGWPGPPPDAMLITPEDIERIKAEHLARLKALGIDR